MITRPPAVEDVPALARFLGEAADGDGPDEAEILSWLESPSHDVAGNFRMWFEAGELVAYSDIGVWSGVAWIDVTVREDARGGAVEEEVLAWNLARCAELGPRAVRRVVAARDGRSAGASARAGFVPVRHSLRMRIELQGAPVPAPPQGIVLREPRPGDERAIWAAHQESFRDVWGHDRDEPYEEWHADRIETATYEPALWVLAEERSELAGVSLCRYRGGHGWVGVLGVRRPWRGRGLGGALLRESFRRFWDRGERVVELGVDSESPTGAVRLYEREGMQASLRWTTFELTVGSARP